MRSNNDITQEGIKNVVLKCCQESIRDVNLSLGGKIPHYFGNPLDARI